MYPTYINTALSLFVLYYLHMERKIYVLLTTFSSFGFSEYELLVKLTHF